MSYLQTPTDGVELCLFGAPRAQRGGVHLAFERRKTEALLIYLALDPRPVARDALANLLWGSYSLQQASANLRKGLVELRDQIGDDLVVTRRTVALNTTPPPRVDLREFEARAAIATRGDDPGPLEETMALYREEVLAGFCVRNAPDFDDWLLLVRERCRDVAVRCLRRLVQIYDGRGALQEAISAARRLLLLDPWQEEMHRDLMGLYERSGRRGSALAQYLLCEQTLAEAFRARPSAETTSLYLRLRGEPIAPTNPRKSRHPQTPARSSVAALATRGRLTA